MSILRSGIAGSCGNSMFTLLKNHEAVFQWVHNFTFPPIMYESSNFSAPLPTLVIFLLFFNLVSLWPMLVGVKWYLTVALVCISLMTNDISHLFTCFLDICLPSLKKCLFKFIVHFSFGLFVFLLLTCKCFLLADNF